VQDAFRRHSGPKRSNWHSAERSIPRIARDLNINEQTSRNWVKRAEIDAGRAVSGELTTDERTKRHALLDIITLALCG
jgi:transposase-like protein